LPRTLSDLDANYEFQLGKTARVADRLTQQVIVKPRDGYRYGYHFWADRETGLLLQADLRDAQGKLLEQFMFTHAVIGGKIAEFALQPQSESKSFTWHREAEGAATPATPAWSAAKLPNGFKLATHLSRQSPRRKVPTQHLVYTDGLATVSVFIERSGKNEALALRGASHMGAVHASTTRQNEFQITAVGEVPMETVHLIAHAMTPTR
jgi:sigma-E factor negative regulatory protein RseB